MPKRQCNIVNLSDDRASNAFLRTVARAEGLHYVCCEKVKTIRSLQANAYYWAIVIPFANPVVADLYGETFTDEEVHELLKRSFLPAREVVNRDTGEITTLTATTTNKDVDEFSEYLEKIILLCRENGVDVPAPDGTLKRRPPQPEWSEETAA